MNKKSPYAVVAPHILPEPKKCALKKNSFALLADFSLETVLPFPVGTASLQSLFPFREKGGLPFVAEMWNESPSPEGYSLEIGEEKIVLKAASERALLHACRTLKQLRNGTTLPCGTIEDYPSVPLRGFHANLASCRQFEGEETRDLLRKMGKFKLNAFLLEYNARFPFSSHPLIPTCNAFSREDVASFERICRENCIEIIPLVQCLGHNAHIRRLEEYAKYFEPDYPDGTKSAQLCPLSEEAFSLFKALTEEILEAHPGGKFLHLGGDEARSLGMCPKCAAFAEKHGTGELYIDYINKCAAFAKSMGRTPIIWDDMLSRHPELIDKADKDLVIMVWDYWTTMDPSPLTVFRPAGKGIVLDRRIAGNDFAALEEPERLIARTFGRAEDLEELSNANEGSRLFRKYLGKEFPLRCTAFPFVDLYLEKGFSVLGAPTALGNTVDDIYGLPNFMRFRKNIYAFAQKCKKYALPGMITTAWFDFAPELLETGMICTANDLWTK